MEDLKQKFESKSKYYPIWKKVKESNILKIKAEPTDFNTISSAVSKLKQKDKLFKNHCDTTYGHQLNLHFERNAEKQEMVIQLIDHKDKFNVINII